MNILITGANGFIGRKLSAHLQHSHSIYKLVRKKEHADDRTFEFDLSDPEKIKRTFFSSSLSKEKTDIIIHCAAMLGVKNNIKDFSLFNENNKITESIIFIADNLLPKTIINLSTIGVYPNKEGIYNETSIIQPSMNTECLYGLSKFCSEELISFFLKDKMSIINLRLSQTFGPGMRNDRVYSIMLNELNDKNTITVFGGGKRKSNFMSIDFFLNITDRLIGMSGVTGTYNVGERNITYLELAETIIKKHGNGSSKIIIKEEGVTSKVEIDSSKVSELFIRNEQ